jgi:hypothetical protein
MGSSRVGLYKDREVESNGARGVSAVANTSTSARGSGRAGAVYAPSSFRPHQHRQLGDVGGDAPGSP